MRVLASGACTRHNWRCGVLLLLFEILKNILGIVQIIILVPLLKLVDLSSICRYFAFQVKQLVRCQGTLSYLHFPALNLGFQFRYFFFVVFTKFFQNCSVFSIQCYWRMGRGRRGRRGRRRGQTFKRSGRHGREARSEWNESGYGYAKIWLKMKCGLGVMIMGR